MKNSKHAVTTLAFAGLFVSFSSIAHAEPAGFMTTIESSEFSSYLPLVLFGLSAIVVYLANRPRVTVCARARRRNDQSRR